MIALQQRHGSILCMCYFQGAIVEQLSFGALSCLQLPVTTPQVLNFSSYSSPTLFVTLKSPLW